MRPFECACPLDARYYAAEPEFFARLKPFVSEAAFIHYQAKVEKALIQNLCDLSLLPEKAAEEIKQACLDLSAEEVYEEEKRIGHNIRALVNCLRKKVSPETGRFIHLFATSNDITDTANALRLQDLFREIILPDLLDLQDVLSNLAEKHYHTLQIGRTHGQHAIPLTFGYVLVNYLARLDGRIEKIEEYRQNLRGKFAGAVGAFNALSLAHADTAPLFEIALLARMGIQPSANQIASQIVQPEFICDLAHAVVSCLGVFANIADDIRHLERTEIAELYEKTTAETVGSSTMPHKINPKDFENVKSFFKEFMPRMITFYLDQISEHQRDLTNSASGRFIIELVTAFDYATQRLLKALQKLEVDVQRMSENLKLKAEEIIAEPLYISLALVGHPSAYEAVKKVVNLARLEKKPLLDVLMQDTDLKNYLKRIEEQLPQALKIIKDPSLYTGQAAALAQKANQIIKAKNKSLRQYLALESEILENTQDKPIANLKEFLALKNGDLKGAEKLKIANLSRKELILGWLGKASAKNYLSIH